MKKHRFIEVYGRPLSVPDGPEIRALQALENRDTKSLLSLFEEEKQFGGISALDCGHGRYDGLDKMRRFIPEWYAAFHAVQGEIQIATQIRCGCRSAVEFVFSYQGADGADHVIPMACAADLRDGLTRLDEMRFYVNCTWVPDYPKYRKPIFPERKTHELRTEMLSGIMPAYMSLVHNRGMASIPELMTRTDDIAFGSYGPDDEIRVVTQKQMQNMHLQADSAEMTEEQKKAYATAFTGLKKNVLLRMETIIDDGRICCVEWEQLVTKTGREERGRLSEPGISFYERGSDGRLKSLRIIDYANTEKLIDWEICPTSREEAEGINFLGRDIEEEIS